MILSQLRAARTRKVWNAFMLWGVIVCGACSSQPQTDSKSNWYSLCASDAECSDALSCTCGVCTQNCTDAASCDADQGSTCLDPGTVTNCSAPAALVCVATCEATEECGDGRLCLSGTCIRENDVDSAFCDEYEDWTVPERDFELLAIEKVNELRRTGGNCQGQAMPAVATLSLDFRLRCAARHQSRAMFEQDVLVGTTPDGVSFTERMTESGYRSRGARVLFSEDSDETHLETLLVDYCADILDSDLVDLGVGKYADRMSILLARE